MDVAVTGLVGYFMDAEDLFNGVGAEEVVQLVGSFTTNETSSWPDGSHLAPFQILFLLWLCISLVRLNKGERGMPNGKK